MQLYGRLAEEVKARRAKGINRNSLMDQVLDSQAVGNEPLLDDEQVAYIGGVLLEGGSDTTSSLTLSFILACCAFPRVLVSLSGSRQQQAQALIPIFAGQGAGGGRSSVRKRSYARV